MDKNMSPPKPTLSHADLKSDLDPVGILKPKLASTTTKSGQIINDQFPSVGNFPQMVL